MTSQKSLKNNVIGNDFKRSFIGSILFPAIAFLVLFVFLTIPVIQYVTRDELVQAQVHNEYSMFLAPGSTFLYMFDLVPIGMVLCGILTAVKSFGFIMSKKQVNVYLSLGIKRSNLLTNRTVSAVVLLFAATFIPMLIIYIVNIVNFGISTHLTELFLYITSLLFVSGVTGYAIATAMVMITGNLFETALTTFSFSLIPVFIYNMVTGIFHNQLKGYVSKGEDRWLYIFMPWTMGQNLQRDMISDGYGDYYDYVSPSSILALLERDTTPDKFKVPEVLSVDLGFTLPIIIWAVLSVLIIGLAYYLFNKRKAEHANSLGKFPLSRAITATLGFFAICYVVDEMLYGRHPVIITLAMLAAAFTGYCIVQLILSRKLKSVLHSLKWYAVLASLLLMCVITVGTEFFGTYNKVPDKADVKSVSIEMSDLSAYAHFIYPWNDNEDFVESTSDESKEAVLKMYELLADEKREYGKKECLANIRLAVRDKEDEVIYRSFEIFDKETYMKYLTTIYGSDFFDEVLKNYLIEEMAEDPANDSTGYLRQFWWIYADSSMLIDVSEEIDFITETTDLCKALYQDLSVMSFEELFRNTEAPVGYLGTMYPDSDFPGLTAAYADSKYVPRDKENDGIYYDKEYSEPETRYSIVYDSIPVYPSMTNTVKYLEDNGYTNDIQLTVKEVFYSDGPMSLHQAQSEYAKANKKNYKGWGSIEDYFFAREEVYFDDSGLYMYSNEMMEYFLSEEMNECDLIKEIYKGAGHPLTVVTDSAKANEIADKTVNNFLTLGDDGRYVYVVYEEGPVVCRYLPRANSSVVK